MKNPFEINPSRYVRKRAREEGVKEIDEANTTENKPDGPIYFSYKYENGALIEAAEDEKGEISIFIKTNKGNFDLKSYIPEGWKFVSSKHPEVIAKAKSQRQRFKKYKFICDRGKKLIIIKNLSDPRDVFPILHEMGHALIIMNGPEFSNYIMRTRGLGGPHVLNETLSKEERRSWANALQLVRRFKSELSIDILEPFGSLEEAQKLMYANLSIYRYIGELEFEENRTKQWINSFFGKLLSESDMRFMEQLFDKRKLAKRYGQKTD